MAKAWTFHLVLMYYKHLKVNLKRTITKKVYIQKRNTIPFKVNTVSWQRFALLECILFNFSPAPFCQHFVYVFHRSVRVIATFLVFNWAPISSGNCLRIIESQEEGKISAGKSHKSLMMKKASGWSLWHSLMIL